MNNYQPISAVAVLNNPSQGIQGFVEFHESMETFKSVLINIQITGLKPNSVHGLHVHTSGDLRKGCDSLCSHYNPFNGIHGDINFPKELRHLGDLGNVQADRNGMVNLQLEDNLIRLRGKHSILGRSVVLHRDPDDLGLGGTTESLKTGTSGPRIACGVIGYSEYICN